MKEKYIKIRHRKEELNLATLYRKGTRTAIVFLHGFGSTKEDYAEAFRLPAFQDHELLAFDFPGSGASPRPLAALSVEVLREITIAALERLGIGRFHLAGHSMGGLAALLLASKVPQRVVSFSNIEGNLAEEDCFFSRQVREHPTDDAEQFLHGLAERVKAVDLAGFPLCGAGLIQKIDATAAVELLASILERTEKGDLLEMFLRLPIPKQFVYGEENEGLSYLKRLKDEQVVLSRIARSSHFPMYTNPDAMFDAISGFTNKSENCQV